MKLNFLILAFFVSMASITCKAQMAALSSSTAAQWKEDVDYFASQLVKKHANAFHNVSQKEFEQDITQLKADIPTLQPYQVVVRLLQITAKVGDGHTYVHLPTDFKIYPAILYWFNDELYVIQAAAQYKEAVGKKLLKVEGQPLEQVMNKLKAVMSGNINHWFNLSNGPAYLIHAEILHTLGIVPDLAHAKFTFGDGAGKEITLDMVPIVQGTKMEWVRAAKEEPLFRQKPSEKFWFTYLQDLNAVYVNFKTYDEMAQNTRKLFDFIRENKAATLIIDIRQNGGGNFNKVRRQMIPAIKENTTINQKDHLFVITGRRTFSAAMVSAIDFKNETNATIIGEPPGEKPNSYSENDEMKLPNSGLVVSYSTRYYKFLPEDVPAFEPHIRVDPDWKNYVAGIDPVMERIKMIIKGK